MSYQDEIDFDGHKEAAEGNGWLFPDCTVSDAAAVGWMRYWESKASDEDEGRPVTPHRSGGGVKPELPETPIKLIS